MSEWEFDLDFFTLADVLEYTRISEKMNRGFMYEGLNELIAFAGEYTSISTSSLMAAEIMPFLETFANAVSDTLGLKRDE